MIPQQPQLRGPGGGGGGSGGDGLFIAAVFTIAGVIGGIFAIVELAAVFAGHPGPKLSAAAVRQGVASWHRFPGDPRRGFPQPLRAALPGPIGMYAAVSLVVVVLVALGVVAAHVAAGHSKKARSDRAARRQGLDADRIVARDFPARPGAIEFARTAQQGRPLYLGADRSLGALLGPGSGKSMAALGWIIDAPGPVLVTSTKVELWDVSGPVRKERTGCEAVLFDPSNVGGQGSLRWSPIAGCEQQETAVRRAKALMAGAELSGNTGNAQFFRSAGAIVIRLALHACALGGGGITELLAWVQDPDNREMASILERSEAAPGWRDDLRRQAAGQGETTSNVGLTVAVALDVFAQSNVRAACSPTPGESFRLEDWAATTAGSLYVVAPRTVESLAALSSAFVEEAFFAARNEAGRRPGHRLDPVIRFVLDELANVCPLDRIDVYITDGRGQGMPVMWIAQTKEQMTQQLGLAKAQSVIDASEIMLYGGGFDTPGLYESISARIGDVAVAKVTTQRDGYGNMTSSTHHEHRPIMTVAELYALRKQSNRKGVHQYGEAILMSPQNRTVVRLMPWWSRKDAEEIATLTGVSRP